MIRRFAFALLLSYVIGTQAFAPSQRSIRRSMELQFGIPTFGPKDDKGGKKDPNIEEKKIGLGGLVQLVTAGLGAPFLGDFQGVDKARMQRGIFLGAPRPTTNMSNPSLCFTGNRKIHVFVGGKQLGR
jgi:hypothetical protein